MREEVHLFESYDLNAQGFVRPSAVLRRLQEIAGRDLDSFGISYQDLRDKNMAFVVSRMALSFRYPLSEGKNYTVRTAAQASHGATFPRSFVIEDEKGVAATATSLWALLDFEKRRLLRADALGSDLPTFPDLSQGLSCKRLSRPKDKKALCSDSRKVYPSLLDRNCHLNNCNYADLALDLFPEISTPVKEIHITFQKEARLGDVLALAAFQEEEGYLVSGSFADREETCFLSHITLF